MSRALLLLSLVLAAPAAAQVVQPCDWQASAANLMEPWELNTRTFSNGRTRIAALDTVEPALGWAWLMVLSPPYDEIGARQCRVIGLAPSMGFAGLDFEAMASDYDPATGLRLTLPVQVSPDGAGFETRVLSFIINQSTGEIGAGFEE